MELPDVGKHCFLKNCRQLDYVPIKCDLCNHFFCSIHGLYEQHKCKIYTEKLNNYVECPLCNIKFTLTEYEDKNKKIELHILNSCKATHKPTVCNFNKCNKSGALLIQCKKCFKKFCTKHRFMDIHKCHS